MASGDKRFPIVGIGASAGGIPAIEGLFRGLDTDGDMAFVIVTHLSPDRESLLHEIVARYTEMPVNITEDGQKVEPGHVYVMPQNVVLTIAEGRFEHRAPNPLQRERKPIDIFFASLAKDGGECSVGIVLSGGDGDGTLGIKAIKEHGGLTLAQSTDGFGPKNPEMPTSAISSGLIDLAVPVEEMGAILNRFAHNLDGFDALATSVTKKDDDGQTSRDTIYELLRNRAGHDFSGYKTKTFLRRVHRRMQVAQVDTIEAYVDRLRHDPPEVMNLFRDLLINVTSFFRDSETFEALNTLVIPKLFDGRGADETVRVWVPGCATGEEVYTLAMLMREHMDMLGASPRVQLFATDIDEAALAIARAGRYPEALLEGISPDRRQRFFTNDGASYVVGKDVREMCIFSPHSVIRDPPFSRMDLVSCRNLLIYFGLQIQQQVVPIFNYALKPGGYLFLGASEGISQHADLFAIIDKKHRIFQSRESASHGHHFAMPVSTRLPGSSRDFRLEATTSGNFPLRQAVEAHVLDRFAPAHVVVNSDGDVVYYSARTGRFLEQPQGAPNRQLLTMLRRGLRLDVRAALREAMDTGVPAVRNDVALDDDDDKVQAVSITVEPLAERGQAEPLYLVLFTPLGPALSRSQARENHRQDRRRRGRGPGAGLARYQGAPAIHHRGIRNRP
jgi:two-component system CheB/CheR fusion protein